MKSPSSQRASAPASEPTAHTVAVNGDFSASELLKILGAAATEVDDFGIFKGRVDWSALSASAVSNLSGDQTKYIATNVKAQLAVAKVSGFPVAAAFSR